MHLELKDYALREDIFGFRNEQVKIMDASAVVSLGFGVESLRHCGMLLPWRLLVSELRMHGVTRCCSLGVSWFRS